MFFFFFFYKMKKSFYFSIVVYLCFFLYNPIYMLDVKVLEVGNYYICNLKDYPTENCTVNYDYNKITKLLCPIDSVKKVGYNPSYCFKYLGVKDTLIINNREEKIYETLPGIILENVIKYGRNHLSIYAPFYVKEDVTIVCTCDHSNGDENITPYIKINLRTKNSFNNNEEYIKGCDYGNNKGKYKFLTKTMSQKENFTCEIEAAGGDVVGINCNNYNSNNFKGIQILPPTCFGTVSFSLSTLNFVTMNINNLLPDAKYFPEFSSSEKDKNFQKFSTTSYLWIPEKVPHEITFFCYCKYSYGVGVAIYNIKKSQ
ncbi:6-cysteine protein, putative [Plasmodium gallinaceum]|uniref:6-cysteine protein, putative n=1 Tax=Plasmodium gallinaceum TaxID=5849 RepID=A0A1J1H0M4_PLAGA|nr:6-cysteine protein, putative [Plasmodium gallinaceum]CRG98115.1 6-cysteine protein, putative [Plasmodium gallinaceum]